MPPCRNRFTEADFDFVASALAGPGCRRHLAKLWRDPEGRREILDLKEVFRHMIESPSTIGVSPGFYFYVLVRHSFLDVDLTDVELAAYVSGVLAKRVCPDAGDPLEDVTRGFTHAAQFLSFISHSTGRMRFHLQVAAGNQFLVLTGLYPDFLKQRNARGEAPGIDFYESFASRAYLSAAGCRRDAASPARRVLASLAESLPAARRSLNRVAEEFVFLGD